jgi:PAS domain S-box-containing protein
MRRRSTDQNSVEILESMSDAFAAFDREWSYTYVNRAAERIVRRRREEMLGRTVWEVFPEHTPEFESACRRAMDDGVTVHYEEYYAPLDAWFENTIYPAADGITLYSRDITARKRMEEALRERERFIHQIAELTPVVINVFDLVTERDTYISSDVFTLLGYTPEEIAQMGDPISPFWHPDDIPVAREQIARSKEAADGEISEFEYRVRRRDGEWRWLRTRSMPFSRDEQGAVRQIVTATLDVTERKRAEEALRRAHEELEQRVVERTRELTAANEELRKEISERKQAEELRRKANERVEMILDSITDRFFAVDSEWRYTRFNKHAEEQLRALDKDPARLIGRVPWEEFPNPTSEEQLRRAMREREVVTDEQYYPPLGEWYENRIYPNSDGGLVIFQRNITERKWAEERLAYHAYLLENVYDAVIATDERLAVTAWNKGAEQIYGWRADEALGRNIWEVVPAELSEERRAEALRELEERGQFRTEAVTYRRDGTPVYVEGITIALRGEQEEGQITGYVNIRRDITDRKRAEEALRRSQERFATIFHASPVAIAITTLPDGRFLDLNDRYLHLIGLSREEVNGRTSAELGMWVNLDDRQRLVQMMREQGFLHNIEGQLRTPSGEIRHVLIFAEVIELSGELCVLSLVQDITERKRAEEELRRSEAHLAEAQRIGHVGSWVWNVATGECFWTQEHFRIFGLDPETFKPTKENTQRLIHPEDLPTVEQTLEKAVRERSDFEVYYRMIRPSDGEIRYHRGVGHPVAKEQGEPEFIGMVVDVTERQRAEEELRRSEAYLAEAQRLSHTGSWAWNVSTGDLFWSQEMFRIYGLDPKKVKPGYPMVLNYIHPEDRSRVQQTFEDAVRDKRDYELAYRVVWADGAVRHVNNLAHPVFDQSGTLIEYVGTTIDTTERVHAEEEQTQLLRRLVTAQEEERRRIAREMHDQFGQELSALTLTLSALKREYGAQTKLGEQFKSLEEIAKQLDADADILVWELRPTVLDDLGLLAALTNYVRRWSKHSGVRADLHVSRMEKDRLTNEIETTLYRITQEALTNVAKHAGAGNVSILLERRSDSVSLIIEDDGIGFDAERAFGDVNGGFGLIGMRERAMLVGGTLEIESEPGGGTTIAIRIPATHVAAGEEQNG